MQTRNFKVIYQRR